MGRRMTWYGRKIFKMYPTWSFLPVSPQTLTLSTSRARATLNLAQGNMLKYRSTAKFLALVYSRTPR